MLKKLFKCKFAMILMAILTVMVVSVVRAEEPTTVSDFTQFITAIYTGKSNIILGGNIDFLTYNVDISKDVTIDLNGHTIDTGTNKINIGSNVAIKDTSTDKLGKIKGTGNPSTTTDTLAAYVIEVRNNGALTLESGTVEAQNSRRGVVITENTELSVTGGAIKAPSYGVYVYENGKFTINSGTIEVTSQVGVYSKSSTTVKVNGGTIKSSGNYAMYCSGDVILTQVLSRQPTKWVYKLWKEQRVPLMMVRLKRVALRFMTKGNSQ